MVRKLLRLNFMGKIFGKILNTRLVTHLERTGTIKESQHGFRKRRSTTSLIANLYERIAREKAGPRRATLVSLVMRDVTKCFDKVWHAGLLYKLLYTGIDPHLLRVLANFLHNRSAYTRVNNAKGRPFRLTAGVPQGDVLSPTLFLVMCNDYPPPTYNERCKNFVKQYADDFTQVVITKFNSKITALHKELHKTNIMTEINRQNDYERLWKLSTNLNKFQIIHLSCQWFPQITIDNNILSHSRVATLLGMKFSYNNFWTKQVKENRNNAQRELDKLWRFRYLQRKLKIRLYKTLILPLLLYPVVPLNTLSKTQLKRLRTVQHRAIEWIFNEKWPIRCPYAQRHVDAKIEQLSDRLKRLAEGVWSKIYDEDSNFFRQTLLLPTDLPHARFPSSYERTFA